MPSAYDGRERIRGEGTRMRAVWSVCCLLVLSVGMAAGSDGIPWKVRSGGIERFTIRLVVSERLIRDYVVTAAYAKPPYTAMASARRGGDFALYRSLILSRVQVRAELGGGGLGGR